MVTAHKVEWLKAAYTTATAAWWEPIAARIFGRKIVGHDGQVGCQGYVWRGKVYMTSFD